MAVISDHSISYLWHIICLWINDTKSRSSLLYFVQVLIDGVCGQDRRCNLAFQKQPGQIETPLGFTLSCSSNLDQPFWSLPKLSFYILTSSWWKLTSCLRNKSKRADPIRAEEGWLLPAWGLFPMSLGESPSPDYLIYNTDKGIAVLWARPVYWSGGICNQFNLLTVNNVLITDSGIERIKVTCKLLTCNLPVPNLCSPFLFSGPPPPDPSASHLLASLRLLPPQLPPQLRHQSGFGLSFCLLSLLWHHCSLNLSSTVLNTLLLRSHNLPCLA